MPVEERSLEIEGNEHWTWKSCLLGRSELGKGHGGRSEHGYSDQENVHKDYLLFSTVFLLVRRHLLMIVFVLIYTEWLLCFSDQHPL